ncbi:hypothetical protein JW964_10465, partial [candidate division KSB1 bacterium]|nr:hypothetical protein [candidate division KSB1 bacterium]
MLSSFRFSLLLICLLILSVSASLAGLAGKWTLIPEKSTEIDLYGTLAIEIRIDKSEVTLIQQWGGRRSFIDSLTLKTDGRNHEIKIDNRVFPTNVFMGLSMPVGQSRKIKAVWEDNRNRLKLTETYDLRGSQGKTPVTAIHTYELSANKEALVYQINRSTRTKEPAIQYLLKPEGTRNAWYMVLEDDWAIDGKLPLQAMLISLQGLANADAPNLYFVYPEKWDFRFTQPVFDFLKNERFYTFKQLNTPEQALKTFKDKLNGYVVWDKQVRTSLIVAFTVAGLEKAVVVSEDQIPLMEQLGLKPIVDFRNQFTGQSDA